MTFDSRSKRYKTPVGCVRQKQPCRIMIETESEERIGQAALVLEDDMGRQLRRVPLSPIGTAREGYAAFQGEFTLEDCGLYYYYFQLDLPGRQVSFFREADGRACAGQGGKWQLTCFAAGYETPPGFRGRVMYQIFPDRFFRFGDCDLTGKLEPYSVHAHWGGTPQFRPDEKGIIQNNDFFGGNLKGILEKLPYLQGLGVEVLYLNPIFKAYSNHRYDTCDYHQIDPMLGTEEDFRLLCRAAHSYGMKVLLDGVFSHTGDRSIYFDKYGEHPGKGAYQHPDSPYRSWFQFDSSDPNGYHSWWGINTLPCTEELDPGFLNAIIDGEDSVVAHWLRAGADGFRLDVADELPDEFIARLHARVKQIKPDALVLGEVWEDASYKISYGVRRKYFTRQELDATMNYPYKDAVIGFVQGDRTSIQLAETVMSIAENYPKPILDCVMNSLSTHDTMRILTVFGAHQTPADKAARAEYRLDGNAYRMAKTKLRMAAFLQFMLPGCPCIYYGDEAGMQGFEDPFNRGCFPWGEEDAELVEYFQLLAQCRHRHEALRTGDIQVLFCDDGVCCFSRKTAREHLVFLVSMRDQYDCFVQQPVELLHRGSWRDGVLRLKKYGFFLLKLG